MGIKASLTSRTGQIRSVSKAVLFGSDSKACNKGRGGRVIQNLWLDELAEVGENVGAEDKRNCHVVTPTFTQRLYSSYFARTRISTLGEAV
jgi:hypothetical protein